MTMTRRHFSEKGASLKILGIANHWCPSGPGASWTLALTLISCTPGSHICGWRLHIFAPCVGWLGPQPGKPNHDKVIMTMKVITIFTTMMMMVPCGEDDDDGAMW